MRLRKVLRLMLKRGLEKIAVKILRLFPPEFSHNLALKLLSKSWIIAIIRKRKAQKDIQISTSYLGQNLFGLTFSHPIGLAAGFDKNGIAIEGLLALGFSFGEVGSVTPLAQAGNPKPRIFRSSKDFAIINRMGFNNLGMDIMARELQKLQQSPKRNQQIIGINLGKNKDSEDAVSDYQLGAARLGLLGNYITLNISSPNTVGLRKLQEVTMIKKLLTSVRESVPDKPILLKLAPDLGDEDLEAIANLLEQAILNNQALAHGVIIGNTTLSRPSSIDSEFAKETGGLSGLPLAALSMERLKYFYQASHGNIPLIGCGGISTAKDAYLRIRAGASLLQIYTSFIYQGSSAIEDINQGLIKYMQNDGFKNISEIIGIDV